MTCPSCGTIAVVGAERCARCGSSLEIPANRPDLPTPVVRAGSSRGEIAQRNAGIFAVSLVPRRPSSPVPPSPPVAPPALAGPVGRPAPFSPPPVTTPAGGAHPPPTWTPPDPPTWAAPDPTSLQRTPPVPPEAAPWALQPPPPALPAFSNTVSSPPPASPAAQTSQVDPTSAFPAGLPLDTHAPSPESPRNEETDDLRPRTVRPGVDASWPPPPGPWSGRRASES